MNNTRDNQNKINESLYNANVELVDKNRYLIDEVNSLKRINKKAREYIIEKSIEYKPGYRKVELDFKECGELLKILESELYE